MRLVRGGLAVLLLSSVAWADGFNAPYQAKPVEAQVKNLPLKPDLSNVSNLKQLPKLTNEQRQALARQSFVARPTREEQLFYLYEHNDYQKIPSFVTTDSVFHTLHVFYDYTLRFLEEKKLLPVVAELSRKLLDRSLADAAATQPKSVAEALKVNIAYFAVPLALLGEKLPALPAESTALLERELKLVNEAQGRGQCLTGSEVIYNQFIVRGHYTRTEALQRYFKAVLWYGLIPRELDQEAPTLQSLIICDQLLGNDGLRELWAKVYEPTAFLVGTADDITFKEFSPLLRRVFATGALSRFNDAEKLAQFRELAKRDLPQPRIVNATLTAAGQEKQQGQQFRFMGQRYIPDSRILQELCYPKVGTRDKPRQMPKGLDVFAVLGSARAAELLDKTYQQTDFANYAEQRGKLQAEFGALKPADWATNVYHGWLFSLLPLLPARPNGYPSFMRQTAWQDKSLITALGSWTELRHDTVLYGKQSVAEAGGEGPAVRAGYVEPEPEVYERAQWLLAMMRQGLTQRGLIGKDQDGDADQTTNSLSSFEELLGILAGASRKELLNQPLTTDELYVIMDYGARLEDLMMAAAGTAMGGIKGDWWSISNRADRSMALVTDVHTSFGNVLQEAVGEAAEIWVIVPFKGRLVATRGAVYQYYEFTGSADARLTDEAWIKRLDAGQAPPPPAWAAKVIMAPGLTKPTAREQLRSE